MFQCFFNEFVDRKVCGESRLRFQIVGTDKVVGAIMPKDAFCGECPEQNQAYPAAPVLLLVLVAETVYLAPVFFARPTFGHDVTAGSFTLLCPIAGQVCRLPFSRAPISIQTVRSWISTPSL